MISFSKVTSEAYAGLTPVEDRVYYLTDTGEIYLNGTAYGSFEQLQANWEESDSSSPSYILNRPELAAVATSGNYYSLTNRPVVPNTTGDWFGIWHDNNDSNSSTVTLSVSGTSARANTFQYCTNISTNNWQDYTLGTAITLTQYQYVLWRNKDASKLLGNNTGHYVFTTTGGNLIISGNIMTLKDKGGQYNNFMGAYDFYQMFKGCTNIIDASALVLPGTVLQYQSYYQMFMGCTGLVHGPRVIGASIINGSSSMESMFEGCTAMIDGPDVLPCLNPYQQTYKFMFKDCTSLVKAPSLPAITLSTLCYQYMFSGCTSLVEAPELPATTLASNCYSGMFHSCSSLKHVKVAAAALGTDYSPYWLNNVSSTGVIECPEALDLSTRGANTAPSGWTVIRTDQPHADWTQTNSTEASYIRNKPTIPEAQVQADWTAGSNSVAYIKYKFMGRYNGGGTAPTGSTYKMTYGDGKYALLKPTGDVTIYNSSTWNTSLVAYAEVAIDLPAGATVIAGTATELVDQPVPGKRNIYVSRLEGGVGKLYLVIVEDLPDDSSTSV